MKWMYYFIILTLKLTISFAQVNVQPIVPSVGLIQKDQLWNILVINSTASEMNSKVELILRDRKNGNDILVATTSNFVVPIGTRQMNVNTVGVIEYNYLNAGVNFAANGFLPIGSYIACYNLVTGEGNNQLAASECVQFDIEPMSPPMLTFPSDSMMLEYDPKQFTWLPPGPPNIFSDLNYDILLAEVMEGQQPEEAIQNNFPIVYETGINISMFSRSSAFNTIEPGKWYAWQVVARDREQFAGKSETFVFKINEQNKISDELVERAPYLSMKSQQYERGVAINHILKISYYNQTTDSIIEINISETGKSEKKVITKFTAVLKPGTNLIKFDLKKYKLNIGEGYEAFLINSRKETYRIRFQVVEYTDKK